MARDPPKLPPTFKNTLLQTCIVIFLTVFIAVNSAGSKIAQATSAENPVCRNGSTENWYHCPQGWTLYMNRCYKVNTASLTWVQAQAVCKSYGGNLIKIISQCEQDWVSKFLSEQLSSVSQDDNKDNTHASVARIAVIEAWIGFVRLAPTSFQWSDGQAGFEQDGFWAVDAFKNIDTKGAKLCCKITSQAPNRTDLRWKLSSCDMLHSSVCELRSCEEHTQHCADGTKCVNQAWLCDGYWDCQDGSDESNCTPTLLTSAPSHCGSVLKGESGTFWSPSFPDKYSPFLNCLWKIEATAPQVLQLLVSTLDIEDKYDMLNIYEGTEVSEGQLIVSLGGKMSNQTVKSQGSFVTVHFVSDYSVQGKGFNISWKAELATKQCGGQLVAEDQESTLSFPNLEYDTSAWRVLQTLNCDWVISSLSSTSILSLQFKNITLVNEDSITIFDGRQTDSPVITHITSDIGAFTPSLKQDFSEAAYTYSLNIPPVITSHSQHLLLRAIISRGSLSSFVISYKNGCDTFISSCSSLILSPGYSRSVYPNSLNCTWTVPRDKLRRHLTLLFLPHFLTEPGQDYVQVFSYGSEQQEVANRITISGLNSSLQAGISSFHGFGINFVTDATINHGLWAAVISYDCVALSVLPPLLLNSTDVQFGAIVGYSCLKGFRLAGPSSPYAVCGWSGQWLPSDVPICEKINCGTIPVPSGAYLTNSTGLTYGSFAQYQCLYGYTMVGNDQATCGEQGWENVPFCKLITCPKEHPPIGGNARAEDIIVGYLREFFCLSGLQLVGSKFSHCNISGMWTEKVPVCQAQKCPNLYGPLNGQLGMTTPVAIGQTLRVICEEGFKLVGQAELTCMDNLQFDHPLPSCVDINECDSSEICGRHQCQNFIGGYSCFCQAGYRHLDNSSHICVDINECQVNNGGCSHTCVNMPGKYSCGCPQKMSLYAGPLDQINNVTLIPNKTCIASCKSFVAMSEGVEVVYQQKPLRNGEFLYGTEAYIICPYSLYPNGASVVSCMPEVGWFPPVKNCTELFCEAPRNISAGTVSYSNLTLGSSVSYSCDMNLLLHGPKIRFCVEELNSAFQIVKLSWTGSEPSCVSMSCPQLQSPAHGKVYFTSTTLNSVAVFRCQCGYLLVGQSVVKCKPDGCWSHPSPICEAQFCLHPGLPEQASISEFIPGFPVESTVRFQCLNAGYWISSEDSIKCLAYKQTRVSTVKPSLDVTISGHFVSLVNLTNSCISTYNLEELLTKWHRMMVQLCRVINVAVDVQENSTNTLTETSLNVSVRLLLSCDNTSMTCHCHQYIQQYFMTTLDHVTVVSWDNKCPNVTLTLNTTMTISDHWFCGLGLRLKDGKQRCGHETLPSCMEDCIDEGIDTLDTVTHSESITQTRPSENIGNESTFIHTSVVAISATKTVGTSLPMTEQPTQKTPASSSPFIHSTSGGPYQTTTAGTYSILTSKPVLSIKTHHHSTSNHELFGSEQTTTNMWTFSGNGMQQTDSSLTDIPTLKGSSYLATPSLPLLSSKYITSILSNNVQGILSSTAQPFSTQAPVWTTTSQTVKQTIWPSSTMISQIGLSEPTTVIFSMSRHSFINEQTFQISEHPILMSASSLTPHSRVTDIEFSVTPHQWETTASYSLTPHQRETSVSYSVTPHQRETTITYSITPHKDETTVTYPVTPHQRETTVAYSVTSDQRKTTVAYFVTPRQRETIVPYSVTPHEGETTISYSVTPHQRETDVTYSVTPHQGEKSSKYSVTATHADKMTTHGAFQHTTSSSQTTTTNCTTYTEQSVQRDSQHTSSSTYTTSKWSDMGGGANENSNTTDCMTTHGVEKQTVSLVQGSPVPSYSLTAPVYSIEVSDFMLGNFVNISCIDAVHGSVNAKVIELLQEFKRMMGSLVCRDAKDATLELSSGNIKFKSTRAKIFMKFSITYSASIKSSVISCGMEFQSYAASHLPTKLEKIEREQLVSICKFVNYTGQGFNVTYSGWSCPNGYLLDESAFQCFHSSLEGNLPTDISTIAMTPSPPSPVLTVPRLSMKFVGIFTSPSLEDKVDENCVKEYKIALIKILAAVEQNLQSNMFKDIYISVDKNVNISSSDKKVVAHVAANLLPLQESLNSASMNKCANFTSLQFREPSQQILLINVSAMYLSACPVLLLSAHGFRTDMTKNEFHCLPGYLINMDNFRCINDILPQYSTSMEISMTAAYQDLVCRNAIQISSQQVVESVYEQIGFGISKRSICNTSQDVILLQREVNLPEGKQLANISIPMVLVNLRGIKSETLNCAEQLYKYLTSLISQSISTMIDSLPHTCKANITVPDSYAVTYKRWTCVEQRVYNSLTHQCDSVTTQAPVVQTTGQNISKRQKRNAEKCQLRPQWNATLPTCIDIEAPTFNSCPEGTLIVNMGEFGPVPVTISLPTVTDNSGLRPNVAVTPDISLPYTFVKNATVVMTATDAAGNIAVCTVNITIIDEIPPGIICPSHLVTMFMKICQEDKLQITYNNSGITAVDNSGSVSVAYDPPEGSIVEISKDILVTAAAVDGSSNVAKCSFIARVENCPEWSLPDPEGGNKSCVPAGTNNQELSCVVYCPEGKGFAIQPPDQYVFSGQWLPHSRVPQCVESRFPDYEVRLNFQLPYQGNNTGDCLKEMLNALIEFLKPRLLSACWNATQDLNLTRIDSVGTFDKGSMTMYQELTAKLKISIQSTLYNTPSTTTAQACGDLILRQLELNGTLQRSCGVIKLKAPVARAGKNSCPEGFSHVNGSCYECPAGTYISQPTCEECPKEALQKLLGIINCMDLGFDCPQGQYRAEPKCIECPIGTFQNSSGSSECVACQPGHSTIDVGAKDNEDCLAQCKDNHFSFTGVEPCLPCPLGSYQPNLGSKDCDNCEFDVDGRSQFPYCKKLCAPGQYSSDGAHLCKLCPQNYFSLNRGSITCEECPDNKITKSVGSMSQDQCEAYDPCLDNPCKHGSQCQRHGREFTCECLSDFTGPTCEDQAKICESQPCESNRSCERHGNLMICSCSLGLTGLTCDQEVAVIDYCLSNPCIYGSCMNTSIGFTCSCLSGFHGDRCDMEIDNCAGITCYNGGVCVDLVDGFQCSCVHGFTGNVCDVRISQCYINYCLNGGTCIDGIDSFICLCPIGFAGDLCEVNVDDCASSPCLNEGLCLDGINSFKCLCLPQNTGNICESMVNPCDTQPCLNGAICLEIDEDSEPGFYCRCNEGYTGQRCEVYIDYCYPMPCSTQGSYSCENAVSSFKCNCLPGWKGHLCEDKIAPCSIQPCLNGATCQSDSETFTCSCPPLFTGPTCEVSVNSCQSMPCQNLGSCVEKTSGYLCHCLPGFTGSLCEENINECESSPCYNNGTCQDGVDAFTCSCQRGFAGNLCQVNIDECLSQPCQHNSSCRQLHGDFMCICRPGFTGKHCEQEVNECSSNPCQHQGQCINQLASFYCICPKEYSGAFCETAVDKCQDHIICLNNATCQKVNGRSVCECTPHYTGADCGKEKTANFDLFFLGDHALTSQPSLIHVGNLSELTLCLWIKFSQAESKGTYLVLASEDGLSQFLILRDSQAISSLFTSKEIILYINDGLWHHFCLVLSTSHWTIFKDGISFQEGEMKNWIFGDSLMLKLGQPVDNKSNDEWFKGHLHGVNIFSFSLDKLDILNASQNCDFKMHGNIFDWITADLLVFGNVQVSMPSQCGQIECSPGDKTHLCSAVTVDKTPPEIVICPGTIVVTSEKSLVIVSWTEPEFSDNVGIVMVKQNFRPGQIFPRGQYLITYVGYDAENNSGECSFQIFVRKSGCVDPPPPINGARMCGEWEHGRYCTPSCTHNFYFLTPIPPFYRCGHEGKWDLSSGNQLIFPMCVRAYQPTHIMHGKINFEGPACTTTFKLKLKEKLANALTQLENVGQLCGTDEVCRNIQGLNIDCDTANNRKRREVSSTRSNYTAALNVTLASILSNNLAESDSLPDNLVQLIKQDQTESDFILTSVDLHLTSQCQSGQMLTNTDTPQCLNCPAGYFMNIESVCSPCPRGWYSDKPQQTFCVQCADGLTTSSDGATSQSQCFAACKAGAYFNVSSSGCELCPVGEYQDVAGQWNCMTCPMGLTTKSSGAKSVNECQDLCGAGQELGVDGICVDCPLGTFSTGQEASSVCTICPYGWTTEKGKAVDQTQCNIKKCDKGYYHHLEDKLCYPCPQGTFQENRGAVSCEPCGINLTTEYEGAISRSLCQPGKVDECELKLDSCSPDTKCVDLDDGFKCEYLCESYCSSLRFCDDETSIQYRECHCSVDKCTDYNSRDSMYKTVVTVSITVTVLATLILLSVVIFCVYRRHHQMKQNKHVRMYRDETELASFTNQAFDSFSTHTDIGRDDCSLHMPRKIATRWHNQSFLSRERLSVNETESIGL